MPLQGQLQCRASLGDLLFVSSPFLCSARPLPAAPKRGSVLRVLERKGFSTRQGIANPLILVGLRTSTARAEKHCHGLVCWPEI